MKTKFRTNWFRDKSFSDVWPDASTVAYLARNYVESAFECDLFPSSDSRYI